MTYTHGKTFTIPAAFTALNGCAQTIEITSSKTLAGEEGQNDLLTVLEVLRSAGAQPVVTKVEDKKVTLTLEQVHVYGEPGDVQVSAKAKKLDEEVESRITKLFEGTSLLAESNAVKVVSTIGALVEAKTEE